MSEGTSIEWTHRPGTRPATMNALVGCQKVSQGCAGCYAIETAHIRAANPLPMMREKFGGTTRSEGGRRVWTGAVTLTEKALLEPLTKKAPRTYFVNSLSDLFYDKVPDEWVDKHFAVFGLCPQHTFIVLTKRPERMYAYMQRLIEEKDMQRWVNAAWDLNTAKPFDHELVEDWQFPFPNVWLGTSVEDQKTADVRIPWLLQTPAAIRFISAEPLLGEIDLSRWLHIAWQCSGCRGYFSGVLRRVCPDCKRENYWTGSHTFNPEGGQIGSGLDWVITGGESGRAARPMHPAWPLKLRDQCVSAGVPFFFKQWGEYTVQPPQERFAGSWGVVDREGSFFPRAIFAKEPGDVVWRVGKKQAGHVLDGQVWQQFPEGR